MILVNKGTLNTYSSKCFFTGYNNYVELWIKKYLKQSFSSFSSVQAQAALRASHTF